MRNRNDENNDFNTREPQHQGSMQDREEQFGRRDRRQGELSSRDDQDLRSQGGYGETWSDRNQGRWQQQGARGYEGSSNRGTYGNEDRGFQERGYQDRGFQNRGWQEHGFQDRGYQGGGFQDRGYQGGTNQGYQGGMSHGYQGGTNQGYLSGQPGGHGWDHNLGSMGNLGSGGSFKGRGPKGYKRSDQRIEEDINDRLMHQYQIDATEVEVKVQNGEVTLTGTVQNRNDKHLIENLVDSIGGVQEIHNQLRVARQGQGTQTKETQSSTTGKTGEEKNLNPRNSAYESKSTQTHS
jgi:hypothetical protein